MATEEYDVGIVGFGPVAATLANLLAQNGVTVGLWEKEAAPYPLPRAVHIDGEAMRVFQQVGIAEALEPNLFINLGMRFVDSQQNILIDWPRPQGVGPQGWNASYRVHQPDLEAALRRRLFDERGVTIAQYAEITAAHEEPDAVRVTVQDRASGQESEARCRYLVGCDGARSFVRNSIGAGLIDLRSNAQWLVIDVMMKRLLPTLSDWTVQLCDPARPTTIARGVGFRRRWEFMIMPGDDLDALTAQDKIWSLLERWITPDDAEIERTAVYRFNAVIADRWRSGRMLIAGDAAHQTPPFLGQGLCAGIRDASNLAWKLAVAIGEPAPNRLLDSYESERSPHVREFVAQAVRVGEVLQATADEAALHQESRAATGPEQMSTPAPDLGVGLHDPDDAWGGKLFVQPRYATGKRMDDAGGNRFLLLVRPNLAAEAERQAAAHPRAGMIVVLADPDESLEAAGLVAVLVRPDRYVLASARDERDVSALLGHLDFGISNRQGKESGRVEPNQDVSGARSVHASGQPAYR